MRSGDVPRAGLQELTEFRQRRDGARSSLTMWSALTAITAAITAAAFPEGILAWGFFLMLTIFFGSISASQFWLLASRRKSWKVLPEGASETTALLEDGLTKSIREWNGDVERWNRKLASLDQDCGLWRRKSEDHGREDGWSHASHALESETLMARGKALMLERQDLHVRRRRIRRAIRLLGDTIRKAELESQLPDPEPDDG